MSPFIGRDRHTVSTSSGKRFPILFGIGATSVLMYLAIHPGCSSADVLGALEISQDRWRGRMRRLRHFKIVVGKTCYMINDNLQHHRELRRILRKLAAHYGLVPLRSTYRRKGLTRLRGAQRLPMPLQLFGSANRAKILMLVASLQETYAVELAAVSDLRLRPEISKAMRKFECEGVLRSRVFKAARLYSINPQYPAASELITFLRRMAATRDDVTKAVQAAWFRREALEVTGTTRHRRLMAQLAVPRKSIWCANRERATIARRRLLETQRKAMK